jgi:hypothetical protein
MTNKNNNKEYDKINEAVSRLEQNKYTILNSYWCANRIAWAWKFRKITEEQKNELTERMVEVFKMERWN